MNASRRVLVVYWSPDGLPPRVGVQQHLRALERGPDDVVYLNGFRPPLLSQKLETYDAVVLHTTFLCLRWQSTFAKQRSSWSWLAKLDCPKIALPQDEYDHSAVLDEWLAELGVDTVFSNFDAAVRTPLYHAMPARARFFEALTGYIDQEAAAYCARRVQPLRDRPRDIVYRALRLPNQNGSHGQLKHRIGLAAQERAPAFGLSADISTRAEDTILGSAWLDFIMSGRAVVGAESGSSVLDRRGEIRRRVEELLDADPDLTFDEVDGQMPDGWDAYAFFAISPRHLEAVVARTCQVLVEGSYSGVLVPDRHYIPVRRDLSDLDSALERVKDLALLEEITERAYAEVYLEGEWTTDHLAQQLRSSYAGRRSATPRHRLALPLARAVDVHVGRVTHGLPGWAAAFAPRRYRSGPGAPTLARAGLVALQSLRRRPRLAKLLVRLLASRSWRDVAQRELIEDLLRLGLLDRFEEHQEATGGPWHVVRERHDDALVLVSLPRRTAVVTGAAPALPARGIVWDHSRVGESTPLDPRVAGSIPVSLGEHGRYEFTALSRLADAHPDALRPETITRGA